MSDQDRLTLEAIDRLGKFLNAIDTSPAATPLWQVLPAPLYTALCQMEDAYDKLCDYTARTAPRAERVAQEAVR